MPSEVYLPKGGNLSPLLFSLFVNYSSGFYSSNGEIVPPIFDPMILKYSI